LARRTLVTTDADGRAVIDAFASGEITQVEAQADEFGVQPRYFSPISSGPKTIRLRPTGRVSGRLVADDPTAVRGWSIYASTMPDDDPTERNSWAGTAEVTTDAEGRFTLPSLAAGKLSLFFTPPDGCGYRLSPQPDQTLAAGGVVRVEVTLARAVRVEGVVRVKGGGPPIAGACVAVSTPSAPNLGLPIWTDDRGRYSFYSLPGQVSASVTRLPAAYVQGLGLTLDDVDIPPRVDRHELPAIEADRGEVVRGVVLDEVGLPVAGAWVTGAWGMNDARGGLSAKIGTTTGPDGSFVLERIASGSMVTGLSARLRDRVTATDSTAMAGQAGQVTLKLVAGITEAMAGRVVDAGGKPVAGARVSIYHRTRQASSNTSLSGPVEFDDSAEVRTGPDGSFRTPRELRRDVEYRAEVAVAGNLPARTPYVRPGGDRANRFADLVLRRDLRERSIAGRVLDREGRAVAGAEVFSTGDGPGRGRVTTDPSGRFRLAGVAGDSVLVFVKARGFRPNGRVVAADSNRAEVVVTRLAEPPAETKPTVKVGSTRVEDKALARRLLAPIFPRILTSGEEFLRGDALEALARSDTDRMIGMVQNQVLDLGYGLGARIALGLLDRDPAEVMEVLRSLDATAALEVFDARPEQPPAWRRGLLDLALARAREVIETNQRITHLGGIADRLIAFGDVESGRAVVREAEALTETIERVGFLYPRDAVARPLARIDLPAALALIGPAKSDDSNDQAIYSQVFQDIALRVAASHPVEAERLRGLIVADGAYYRDSLVPFCGVMARSDLPRARRLALAADNLTVRAMALGAIANTLAKSNPSEARIVLDQAFSQLEIRREDGMNSAEEMAWLLPVAERIDPRTVSDYLWRCLAGRSRIPAPATANRVRSLAVVATLVGRYDHEAAVAVFSPVLNELPGLIATEESRYPSAMMQAVGSAAAFDPRAVATIIEQVPENIGLAQPKDAARVAAAKMIALTQAERIRELARRSSIVQPDAVVD
jgi:protocatechuate 3,4-dioxygenase beta subunit